MVKLDNYQLDYIVPKLSEDSLKFLNLGGRKALHSQGIFGQGVTVAVIDTGVNADHQELKGRVLPGKNFCRYGSNKGNWDDHGHGTHCAGSIAGNSVGMAPKAKILPIKVLTGGDGDGEIAWLVKGIDYAISQQVDIISMSLSTDGRKESKAEMKSLHDAVKRAYNAGILIFCSAGNTGDKQVRYPACYHDVLCVGAVDIEKNKAMFSTEGTHVDICQVGVNVISAWHRGGYASMNGTSMSTPTAAGLAALQVCKYRLICGIKPSVNFMHETIRMSTKDLGIKGFDPAYGFGFYTLQPLQANIWLQNNNKTIMVNGVNIEMDVEARIEEPGRFILPARFFTDAFGTYTNFNPEDQSALFIS